MIDQAYEEAEELLPCNSSECVFRNLLHPNSCPAYYRDAVAARLRERDEEIRLLSEQNDRLHELSPDGQPCACNYDERGTVCGVHRVYLEKIAGKEIALYKKLWEEAKEVYALSVKTENELRAEIKLLKADRDMWIADDQKQNTALGRVIKERDDLRAEIERHKAIRNG